MDSRLESLTSLGTEWTLLSRQGESLGGRQPFLVVVEGIVDVRGVVLSDGRPWGPREPLLSLAAGDVLWDVDGMIAAYGLELTARDRARLVAVPWAVLEKWASDPERRQALLALAEDFLGRFAATLSRNATPGSAPVKAPEGGEHPFEAGELLAAPEGAPWASPVGGELLLLGTESPGEGPFFAGAGLWLRTLSEGAVQWLPASEIGRQVPLGELLRRSLALFWRLASVEARLDLADQWNVSRTMAALGRERFKGALANLGTILSRGEERKAAPAETPWLKVGARLGEAMGFSLPRDLQNPQEITSAEDLGRALSLRVRKVALEKGWWRKEGLPLIAFAGDDEPLALIPRGRRYHLYRPGGGSEVPVTAVEAATIAEEAFAVYRPLPAGSLKKGDLFSFGLFRSGGELLSAFVVALVMGGLGLLVPVINGKVFQDLIPAAERGEIVDTFLILVALALTTALLRLFQQLSLFRVESRMDHDLETALWDRLLRLKATFFRRYSAGDLANRAFGLYSVHQYMSQSARTVVTNFVFSLLYLAQMFYYDWKVALAAAACLACLGAAMALAGLVQIRYQRKMVALQNRLSGMVLQILSGLNKIRVAAAEEPAFARWANLFGSQRLCNYRSGRAVAILSGFASAFPALCAVIIFLVIMYGRVGYPDEMGQAYDLGRFVSFWSAYGAMQGAFLSLVSTVMTLFAVLPLYEALSPVLDEEPEVGDLKADPGLLRGKIDLSSVTFRYDREAPILFQNLSLSVKPGEFLALVGPSGSGKSTIIRLLLGFEFPERGDVFYDDKPLKDMDLRKVRSQIGVVLQQGGIIAGDLFSNIVCSRPLSIDQAWEAARIAGLDEDIKAMPMGMHTMITEGANTLSGGQRQRLAIARAVVARPSILLFDEATSALDNRTQDEVSRSLEQLQATRIVVAHRLSTIRNADRIAVIAGGAVAEVGTFDELMERRGLFYELSLRQMT